jgi:hypothetical protein
MKVSARPLHLALFRICVVGVTLASPEPEMACAIARAPSALRFYPGWLSELAHVPLSPSAVDALRVLFYASGGLALVGLYTRLSLSVLTLAALVLFGVAQLTGEVVHDMHLVWMLAVLAVAPSDEALSVDRAFARGLSFRALAGSKRPSAPAEIALASARALLGVVYFFPGFWKLATSGLAWVTSDNVRNQMWWKWAEWGVAPALRVDRVPGLVEAGAGLVVAFELSFFVLAAVPRARRPLALVGLLFHQATRVFFFITFTSLWACYGCLVFPRARALGRRRAVSRRTLPGLVVGVGLFVMALVQGVRGETQSYPFACYPTFAARVGPEMPDVAVEIERDTGERSWLPRAPRSQSEWGTTWQIAGLFGRESTREAKLAFARGELVTTGIPPGTRALRLFVVLRSVEPGSTKSRVVRELVTFSPSELSSP